MKFDIKSLTTRLDNVNKELKEIDNQEIIKTYGTFLDSKKEIIQLYILFIFFGIHGDIIKNYPEPTSRTPTYSMNDYDVD